MAESLFMLRDASAPEISESNFLAIFAVLISQLHLTGAKVDTREKSLAKKVFARKMPDYSFSVASAIGHMQHLRLQLKPAVPQQTAGQLAFRIEPAAAFDLLKKYFSCHLLHNPACRTATCLTSQNTTLQITPKGTAMVQRFYEEMGLGLDQMPAVINSNFNTMRLFEFRRSKASGRALYSDYFNHILTSEMFGPAPHVWSPSAKNEASTEMQTRELLGHGAATFDYVPGRKNSLSVQSPFYHRYFSNPESDCHIQYFEAGSGMRVFHNRVLENKACIPYCFSGKAFVQWLMDCSTLHSCGEVAAVGQILLRHGLMVHVTPGVPWDKFVSGRETLYALTPRATCRWDFAWHMGHYFPEKMTLRSMQSGSTGTGSDVERDSGFAESGNESDKVGGPERDCGEKGSGSLASERHSLWSILSDPGLSFLFQKHLEKEQCAENLHAWTQIDGFLSQKKSARDLARLYEHDGDQRKRELVHRAATALVRKRLFLASQLYARHFATSAPHKVNIGFDLQQQLERVFEAGPRSETEDLRNYMQTPVSEKRMFGEGNEAASGDGNEAASGDGNEAASGEGNEAASGETGETALGEKSSEKSMPGNSTLQESLEEGKAENAGVDELHLILEPLHTAQEVFSQVAGSIYRLMETDSYVNFLRSEQFAQAMQTLRINSGL